MRRRVWAGRSGICRGIRPRIDRRREHCHIIQSDRCGWRAGVRSQKFCRALVNFGRSYIYSTNLPPAVAAAAEMGLTVMREDRSDNNACGRQRPGAKSSNENWITNSFRGFADYSGAAWRGNGGNGGSRKTSGWRISCCCDSPSDGASRHQSVTHYVVERTFSGRGGGIAGGVGIDRVIRRHR